MIDYFFLSDAQEHFYQYFLLNKILRPNFFFFVSPVSESKLLIQNIRVLIIYVNNIRIKQSYCASDGLKLSIKVVLILEIHYF